MISSNPRVTNVRITTLKIPTDALEADGTLEWDATTILVVEIEAGSERGIGYSYTAAAAGEIVKDVLADCVRDRDPFAIPELWEDMVREVRNLGWRGICATAISAVDVALWDLKARLLGVALVQLLGSARPQVPIYGSGGFTSYTVEQLCEQVSGWVERDGCRFVKMKVGSAPDSDVQRVTAARRAIGSAALFVDANGAYTQKQALDFAGRFAELDVTWFEEPVSSDDLEGLRAIRQRIPPPMEIAAGEYGYEPFYFRRMLDNASVDVLQADATRCCGITGFLRAAALADSYNMPLSTHTAPSLHLHVSCAVPRVRHVEWFYDHVRIERMIFDGVPIPMGGTIRPDLSRTGHGLELKRQDIERLAA